MFELVAPILASARKRTKPRKIDLHGVFCAILYVLKSGCQWSMIPSDFPKKDTVYYYFKLWKEKPSEDALSLLEQALKKMCLAWSVPTAGATPRPRFSSLSKVTHVLADGGYTGQPFADGVQEILGATVAIAKRKELHTFALIPQRRVVERSFAWLEKCRRLRKNCERQLNTSLQMVNLALLVLLLKKY